MLHLHAYLDIQRGVFRAGDQVAADEDCVALLNHVGELGVADWQDVIGRLCCGILCDSQLHAKDTTWDKAWDMTHVVNAGACHMNLTQMMYMAGPFNAQFCSKVCN